MHQAQLEQFLVRFTALGLALRMAAKSKFYES